MLRYSKNKTGRGYWLAFKPNPKTRQSEISRISFETQVDYLDFLGKAEEFRQFAAHAARTAASLPELLPLLLETPKLLLDHAADWPGLLAVCAYFRQHPRPNAYVRNLPLPLPTKFVEQPQQRLPVLLDWLLPDHLNAAETDFFRRFHLLPEAPSVKVRFLDEGQRLHPAVSQISLWASEFRLLKLASGRVLIVENLTSFLAFPPLENSLAIWGGGFAVGLLAGADWLLGKQLFYWGDSDVHGFQILARLRAHYPAAKSLLMDAATFARFHGGRRGGDFNSQLLPHLTEAEQQLYQHLLATNARLEQEQLPLPHVAAAVAACGTTEALP